MVVDSPALCGKEEALSLCELFWALKTSNWRPMNYLVPDASSIQQDGVP
jgi:hypothetical protein